MKTQEQVETTAIQKPEHHPYGMSTWPVFAQCIHFAPRKDETGNKWTQQGTDAHAQLAAILQGNLDPQEACEEARWAASAIKEDLPETATVHVEKRVEFPALEYVPFALRGVYGTADVVVENHDKHAEPTLTVYDLKTFGNGRKSYAEQLAGYAAAFALHAGYREPQHVKLVELHGAIKKAYQTTTTVKTCIATAEKVVLAILGKGKPPAICDGCDYCRNRPCEAWKQAAREIIPAALEADYTREHLLTAPAFAALALLQVETVAKFCAAVRADCLESIKQNGLETTDETGLLRWQLETPLVSWQIKQRPGNRKITAQGAYQLAMEHKLTAREILSCASVSAAKLKKLLIEKGLSKQEAATAVEGNSERGNPVETLARKDGTGE